MRKVELTRPLLHEEHHYNEGDVIEVGDEKAATLLASGHATARNGDTPTANRASPLAEAIVPEPPGGMPVNPADAIAPKVADNPGLVELVKAAGKQGEVSEVGTAATVEPAATRESPPQKTRPAKVETSSLAGAPATATTLGGKAS